MANKLGLGSNWSFKRETTVGTFVAPDRSVGYGSATITPNQVRNQEAQLVAGVVSERVEDSILNTIDATLSASGLVKAAKFGAILNTLTGSTVTPTGGTAKAFVFPVGLVAPDGANAKSLSSQIGFADGSAVSFRGGQTTSFKIMASKADSLKFELEQYGMEMQAGTAAPSKASPAYTASEGFGFVGSLLQFAGGSIGSCVSSFEATVTIPRQTGEQCLNGSEFPLEAFVNDWVSVEGSFTAKWNSDSEVDAFRASTFRTLKLQNRTKSDLVGAAGTKGELTLDIANFLLTGFPVNVGGPGALELSIPFKAFQAASDPLAQLTYVTLDTTV